MNRQIMEQEAKMIQLQSILTMIKQGRESGQPGCTIDELDHLLFVEIEEVTGGSI